MSDLWPSGRATQECPAKPKAKRSVSGDAQPWCRARPEEAPRGPCGALRNPGASCADARPRKSCAPLALPDSWDALASELLASERSGPAPKAVLSKR